jgi:hypothetical protein
MKKFYHLVFLLLLTLGAAAQPYGNEWINYSQQYYKFPITKAGVYRIDSTALATAGINTVGLNPANFQVFGRSQQLNIFVNGEGDGTFNNGDYIEFYAEGNDGWLDSLIYAPGQKQANPYWSLFSDTAYYYLSWNTTGGNQRMNSIAWQANNGLPVTSYFIREFVDIRDNPPALSTRRYRFGELDAIGGTDPEYITGECWAGARITATNAVVSIPAVQSANAVNVGINAEYEARFVSLNNNPASSPNHRYKLRFANSAEKDTSFTGYQQITLKISVPTANLGATTSQATWTYLNVPPATAAQSSLVYQKLRYPHTYNLENAVGYTMYVPDNVNNSSAQINITNFNNSASAPIVYDITNGNRISPSVTGTAFSIIAPNGNPGNNKFFVTSNAKVTYITGNLIKPVSTDPFHYAQFVNYQSEVINHDFLIVTHKSLMPSANQYKTYKNLRGFNAAVIDIDDLYDQFAAGVKKNPLSMRRFAEYALDTWTVKPQYLFMIGKSVEPTFWRIGNDPPEFDSYNQNMVPSFGYPPSDVLITAHTNNSGMAPTLMTGRLSTPNNTEIDWYLDKVMQYESNDPAEWMKNVAHFAGGTSANDVAQFSNYLNNYKQLLEDTAFGGVIRTFTKNTSDPIDISLADSVRNLVNNGISIMNFFGHASGNGFDISIDEASTYDNYGKYPLMIGNSCFAGDIHQPRGYSVSTSENFVSIQNKGAIAFLASITLGIPPYLNVFTNRLIENISWRKYGQPLGVSIKDIGDYFASDSSLYGNHFIKSTYLEMTLNGDPSLVINSFPRPDYEVTAPGVFFDPADVTTDLDTFAMKVVITNLGRAVADTFILDINRRFPNNTDTTYKIQVANVYYKDTITVKFPVDQLRGVGINTFNVRADFPSDIDEMNEFNNDVIATLNIRSTDISPVYPYDYAIVPSGTITLKGSTYDPFAPSRTYRLQVDTTDLFINPIVNTTVTQGGGVVNFPVNLTLPDSTVYFWRISPEPQPGDTAFKWREQSFQVINGLTGWSQDHFFQFKKDQFNLIKYDRPNRLFKFFSGYKTLTAYNKNFCNTCYSDFPGVLYKIDVDNQDYDGYLINNAIHVAVIDSLTLQPWGTKWTDNTVSPPYVNNPTHAFGQINGDGVARQRVEYYFIFRPQASATQMNNMLNMLHAIPKSAYVLAYSWNETMFSDINGVGGNANWNTIKTFFRDSLHASSIDSVGPGRSWIFFGKKNDPSVAQQVVSDTIGSNDQITLVAQLPTDRSYGSFTSTKIGPAQAWNTLKWRSEPGESSKDTIHLKIIGIQANGAETTLINALTLDSATFNLSTVVNSDIYPYLKLNAYMRDDSVKTPMQLDRWQVYYTPYPEFAVNPLIFSQLDSLKLQEGENMTYRVTAENVTPFSLPASDSLKVNWWVFDGNNVRHDLPLQKIKPIAPNDIDTLMVTNGTIGYKGINTLWLELNAFGNGHRVEPYHFNNYATRSYEVTGDKINPLLDVTFDGLHVMDGDIISPKPMVVITLKDENRFLALDTSSFKVFLTDPLGNQVLIPYINNLGEIVLDFTPPNLPANNAKIQWAPNFTLDGKYSLLVQAKDKTGNVSGKNDYRITFEVINKATITQVMNYPNPFSDRTKFVFTLTGSEVPTYFKIQIMTITGKVVREINVDELGPIHIGRNITEYAWDGRDEFGDQLANGVYLYRVVTKLNGEVIERRESGADNWYKQGFGKMYLMR